MSDRVPDVLLTGSERRSLNYWAFMSPAMTAVMGVLLGTAITGIALGVSPSSSLWTMAVVSGVGVVGMPFLSYRAVRSVLRLAESEMVEP